MNNIFDNNYKAKKITIELGNNTEINSNVISNEFINKTLKGGYIDDVLKNRISKQLAVTNKLGGEMNSYLKLTFHSDSIGKLGYFVNFRNCNFLNMKFSRDLFNLSFYGNKMFEGKTADMGNSEMNYVNYDQFVFGIISKYETNECLHEFSFGFGINMGRKSLNVDLKKGELFTQNYGEYIDFSTDYGVCLSDTSRKKTFQYSGFGTSINFYYTVKDKLNNILSISVENVGSIYWNENSYYYSRPDTSFHFDGWSVPDFINMNNETFEDANIDSIVNRYAYKYMTNGFISSLPSMIHVSYFYNTKYAVDFNGGIKYLMNPNYTPLYYLKAIVNPDKYSFVSLIVSYGGYGNSDLFVNHEANFGLEFGHDFKKGFIFGAGSNYVNGFIYPRTTRGEGFYFVIKKII